MDKIRQRKLEARANRQESMRLRYAPTVEKTIIQVPQPNNMIKNEIVEVKEIIKSKLPKITVEVKRGRGRPRKETTEKILITTSKKATRSEKKVTKLTKGRR